MQRNYPRMFSTADDQDKDGFKLENVVFMFRCRNALKIGCTWYLYKRLINFVEKHRILYRDQYGFRRNHSTEMAIISLTTKITEAIENNEFTAGIFLGLSKAFDTVNHTILIEKLEHYGIRGIALEWFKNYLTNRSQIVNWQQHIIYQTNNLMWSTTRFGVRTITFSAVY